MKNLRRDFERFCYRHQSKGIPNLMLYLSIGMAVMYIFMAIDPSNLLYSALCFDRSSILHGQVWRLITYVFIPYDNNPLFLAISMYFYYYIGRTIESQWGTFRFNLFYFSGVVITDWWMQHGKSPEFPAVKDNAYRIRSRVDVYMPGSFSRVCKGYKADKSLIGGVGKGGVTRGELEYCARSTLRFILRLRQGKKAPQKGDV